MRSELPDDFSLVGPSYRFLEQAWERHPERAELDRRSRERGATGRKTWQVAMKRSDDGWLEYWQLPVDPRDLRESIRIGAWPEKRETDAIADERARVDELHVNNDGVERPRPGAPLGERTGGVPGGSALPRGIE
jgi:hypothetical protein